MGARGLGRGFSMIRMEEALEAEEEALEEAVKSSVLNDSFVAGFG